MNSSDAIFIKKTVRNYHHKIYCRYNFHVCFIDISLYTLWPLVKCTNDISESVPRSRARTKNLKLQYMGIQIWHFINKYSKSKIIIWTIQIYTCSKYWKVRINMTKWEIQKLINRSNVIIAITNSKWTNHLDSAKVHKFW